MRRVAGKISRKYGQLRGKPDTSPWIIRPAKPSASERYVDFLFALNYASPNGGLVRIMAQQMGRYGLSLLPVNDVNLDRVRRDVSRGLLRPHVFLDLCSAEDESYLNLLQVCADQGIYPIGDPATMLTWTTKATSHSRLEQAGFPLPPTVILKRSDADRELTVDERRLLGQRCAIKPSGGLASRGTVLDVDPTASAIAQARQFNRSDDWLIQKMISWIRLGDHAGYLRAYWVFGHRTLLWWAKINGIDTYQLLTWVDFARFDLMGAIQLVDRLAETTKMDFFSTEIAITKPAGDDRFVLIDYVNDQCDLDPEPGPGKSGLPIPWCTWACNRIAEFVWRIKTGLRPDQPPSLWLEGAGK